MTPRVRVRPDDAPLAAFTTYVYERENECDWHLEWWLHVGGCRKLLKVTRHTLTHEIRAVTRLMRGPARIAAGAADRFPEAGRYVSL